MDGSTFPKAMTPTVSRLEADDAAAWETFLAAHPEGTPFHSLAWRDAVRAGLGHDTPYLIARIGGETVGILPLVHVKTRLFGNSLVSTGFSVGGGILARDDVAAEALAAAAIALGEERNVDCLELRGTRALFDGWPTKAETYAGFAAPLIADADERLKAIPRKKRADVRKGIKAGFTVDAEAPVAVFHDLYARNLHALGTPILPLRWYAALKDAFGDACEISTVGTDNGPVVALMTFWWGGTVHPYYVGALAEARKLHAFDHVYWDLMERAAARGIERFDFGRSKYGTGAFDYKKYWGFEAEALPYQYRLIRGDAVPDVNPNNPKYARFVKTWQKLPFGVTKRLGPLSRAAVGMRGGFLDTIGGPFGKVALFVIIVFVASADDAAKERRVERHRVHGERFAQKRIAIIERAEIADGDFLKSCSRGGIDELGLWKLKAKCACIDAAMDHAKLKRSDEIHIYLKTIIMSYTQVRSADRRYMAAARDTVDRIGSGSMDERQAKRISYFDTLIGHAARLCPGLCRGRD